VTLECRCAFGWICEAHPERPWPHEDCPGPGMQCDNPACLWWQGDPPAALTPPGWVSLSGDATLEE
jgi:hypothetical protein